VSKSKEGELRRPEKGGSGAKMMQALPNRAQRGGGKPWQLPADAPGKGRPTREGLGQPNTRGPTITGQQAPPPIETHQYRVGSQALDKKCGSVI
jgi:hypothetical protein